MARTPRRVKETRVGTWSFMQTVLGTLVVLAFICLIFSWMYYPPKSTDGGVLAILNQLTGVLGTLAVAVITFYFGSSKGSQDKDDAQKVSTQAAATAATAVAATAATTADALKAMSGTGSGNGDPHPPDSVNVETKITSTKDAKKIPRKQK